jgi:hypothetical protein
MVRERVEKGGSPLRLGSGRHPDSRADDLVGGITSINAHQSGKAVSKKQRAHEKDNGERGFKGQQSIAKPTGWFRAKPLGGTPVAAAADCARRSSASAAESGHQPGHQRRKDSYEPGDSQHVEIESDIVDPGKTLWRNRGQCLHKGPSEPDPEGAPSDRQQRALNEQLSDETTSASAQRHPDRELALTGHSA